MAENNSLLQGSGPGTSSSFGVALRKDVMQRKDQQTKKADKFAKKLGIASGALGVAEWFMDTDMESFNNSNTTLYGKLQGLMSNSESILTQNNAIVNSGKSYTDHFTKQRYDESIANLKSELELQGKSLSKNYDSSSLLKMAAEQGRTDAEQWKTVRDSAINISQLDIAQLKDLVSKQGGMPDSLAEFMMDKVGGLKQKIQNKDSKETLDAKDSKLTLENLQGPAFNELRGFATALETWSTRGSKGSGDGKKAIETLAHKVASIVNNSEFSVVKSQTTLSTPVEIEDPKTGEKSKVIKVITTTTDSKGDVKTTESEGIQIDNLPREQIVTAQLMEATDEIFNNAGAAKFASLIKNIQDTSTLTISKMESAWAEVSSDPNNLSIKVDDVGEWDDVLSKVFQEGLGDIKILSADPNNKSDIETRWGEYWSLYQTYSQLGLSSATKTIEAWKSVYGDKQNFQIQMAARTMESN